MNGLIHNCSHPSDDVHFRISEEKMFADMFHYLEVSIMRLYPEFEISMLMSCSPLGFISFDQTKEIIVHGS